MTVLANEVHTGLKRADDMFEAAFVESNARAIADLYTEDAMLLPAGTDFIKGRQAIQQYWQSAMDNGVNQVKLHILEIEDHADTAISTGEYTLTGKEGQTMDRGKYMVMWKHDDDGDWKLYRDIWTTSVATE